MPAFGEQRLSVTAARVEHLLQTLAPKLVRAVPGQLGDGPVGVDDPPVSIDAKDSIGQQVEIHHSCARRCRAASKHRTAAAIPTFSDSVRPAIGIVTTS